MFFSGGHFLPRDQQVLAIRLVLHISGNPESASPRFREKCARLLSFVKAGSGNETRFIPDKKQTMRFHGALVWASLLTYKAYEVSWMITKNV